MNNNNNKSFVYNLALAALFAALSYVAFQFFKFDIPVGTEKTAIHLGNAFVVLAALLLGPKWGALAGAVGLTLADLTSGYATYAPQTFVLKLCIGLIAGILAHKVFHITSDCTGRKLTVATIVSTGGALLFNVFADPLVGYLYKQYIFGIPQDLAVTLAKFSALATLVNAVVSTIVASLLYLALRPVLKKAGLFETIGGSVQRV